MSNLNQLIQVIRIALTSSDNSTRQEAEAQIIQYKDTNPTEFFFNLACIMQNENNDPFLRQSAGTVASRLLTLKNNNTQIFHWDEIHSQKKDIIKQKVLGVLISDNVDVMKAGASVIAAIASIDLPRGQWQNVVDVLAQNCTNSDPNFKNASVTTLGFICEQIKNIGHRINERLSEQILGAIIVGTRQSETNIIKTSLKALEDSLFFLESMMSQTIYRDTVFEVFTNNFKNNIFVENTYRALYQFVRAASPFLNNYTKAFTDLTEIHLQKRDGTSILNLQMWDVIGSGYADKMARMRDRVGDIKQQDNFLQAVSSQVLPNIMKCLLIMNKNEQDDEDLRLSATKALQSFVKVCDKNVVELVTNSVAAIIISEDPYHQQASVPLFSTISDYSDRDYVMGIFRNGFDHLFGLLQNQNKIVVKNSLLGFIRLAQAFPQVFIKHNNVEQVISIIFNFVTVDFKDIRQIAVAILFNISDGLKSCPEPINNDPSILLTKLVQFFTQNKFKLWQNQNQIIKKVSQTIMNIIISTSTPNITHNLIDFMIEEYYRTVNVSLTNIQNLVGIVIGILHTALLAHKSTPLGNQIMVKLCELFNYQVKKFGVQGQGLSILSGAATAYGKDFENYIFKYWPLVSGVLQNPNDIATYKSALICIGDFARVMQTQFLNYASPVLKKLLQNIKQSYDRELKLAILVCIGDLVLSMQVYAEVYLDDILKIIDICFYAVYQLLNNEKDIEYAEQLKSHLIELYSCIGFALCGNQKACKTLYDHFGNVATFIVRTCDKNVHPTVDYLKICLFLIHDLTAFFTSNHNLNKSKISQIINSNEIEELQRLLLKYDQKNETKQMINFIQSKRF